MNEILTLSTHFDLNHFIKLIFSDEMTIWQIHHPLHNSGHIDSTKFEFPEAFIL